MPGGHSWGGFKEGCVQSIIGRLSKSGDEAQESIPQPKPSLPILEGYKAD